LPENGKQSQPPKLKEAGSLELQPTLIFVTQFAACTDNTSLGLDVSPTLVLNSADSSDSLAISACGNRAALLM
jgi:hypothetical protein